MGPGRRGVRPGVASRGRVDAAGQLRQSDVHQQVDSCDQDVDGDGVLAAEVFDGDAFHLEPVAAVGPKEGVPGADRIEDRVGAGTRPR